MCASRWDESAEWFHVAGEEDSVQEFSVIINSDQEGVGTL